MSAIWLAMLWHWMHLFDRRDTGCTICGSPYHNRSDCPMEKHP